MEAGPPVLPGGPLLVHPGGTISGKGNSRHKVKDGDGAPQPGRELRVCGATARKTPSSPRLSPASAEHRPGRAPSAVCLSVCLRLPLPLSQAAGSAEPTGTSAGCEVQVLGAHLRPPRPTLWPWPRALLSELRPSPRGRDRHHLAAPSWGYTRPEVRQPQTALGILSGVWQMECWLLLLIKSRIKTLF